MSGIQKFFFSCSTVFSEVKLKGALALNPDEIHTPAYDIIQCAHVGHSIFGNATRNNKKHIIMKRKTA